ncbi:MAG: VOC family protein [Actinomycetota bacterium]
MSDPSRLTLERAGGLELDHIALAVPSMERGLEHVRQLTGAEPLLLDAEDGQWYRSASLPLGRQTALEILAPNPDHKGVHPLAMMIRGFTEPRLLFWYLATNDLDRFGVAAGSVGAGLHRIQQLGTAGQSQSVYRRAQIGKRFVSAVPQVIEWQERHDRSGADDRCSLLSFAVSHPDADQHNRALEAVGATTRIDRGEHALRLDFDSPRGAVRIESAGFDATVGAMARGVAAGLFRRF